MKHGEVIPRHEDGGSKHDVKSFKVDVTNSDARRAHKKVYLDLKSETILPFISLI